MLQKTTEFTGYKPNPAWTTYRGRRPLVPATHRG